MYVDGTSGRVIGDAANPWDKDEVLSGAERQFTRDAEAKRIIEFAERNVPDFR